MNQSNNAPMPVSLRQFEYFLAAVEHGSMSAAAKAKFISQPSISEQIRSLERALGVDLFVRTSRTLVLTNAAKALVPFAENALTAARAALDSVAPEIDLDGGTVAFGTFSIAGILCHTEVITDFHKQHPNVRLRLTSDHSNKIADQVRDGSLESGLVGLPINDDGLDTIPLGWAPQLYYFTHDRVRAGKPKTIADIADAPLVMAGAMWSDNAPTHRVLMEAAQSEGLSILPDIEASPINAMELAAAGVADTIAPYPLAQALGLDDSLHRAPLEPIIREKFAFIKRRQAPLTAGALALQQLVESCLRRLPTDAPETAVRTDRDEPNRGAVPSDHDERTPEGPHPEDM